MPNDTPIPPDCYSLVHPFATYTPWRCNGEFADLMDRLHGRTMIDTERLWELWDQTRHALRRFRNQPVPYLIQVGAWKGGSAAVMAHAAASVGSDAKVLVCDTFSGCVKNALIDGPHYQAGGEHADATPDDVRETFELLGLANYAVFTGVYPDDTWEDIDVLMEGRGHFALAHIDVDTHKSTEDAAGMILGRMKAGGVIIFDDYGFPCCPGVTICVDNLSVACNLPVVRNLNGNAVAVKTW